MSVFKSNEELRESRLAALESLDKFLPNLRKKTPVLYDFLASIWVDCSPFPSSAFGKGIPNFTDSILKPALTPLIELREEFLEIAKPYRTRSEVIFDVMQPIRGIINVVNSLWAIVTTPVVFVIGLIAGFGIAANDRRLNNPVGFICTMSFGLAFSFGTYQTVTNPFKGLMQIASSLFLLPRLAIRGAQTYLTNNITTQDQSNPQLSNSSISDHTDTKSQNEVTNLLNNQSEQTPMDMILNEKTTPGTTFHKSKPLEKIVVSDHNPDHQQLSTKFNNT